MTYNSYVNEERKKSDPNVIAVFDLIIILPNNCVEIQ